MNFDVPANQRVKLEKESKKKEKKRKKKKER